MNAEFQPPFAMSAQALDVQVACHPDYVEAVVSGFKSPAGAIAVVARMGEALRQSGLARILIDVRDVIGQMATVDHGDVGSALARHLGPVRCAVVARADRPRGEIAPKARAGGVDYEAFDDPEAARTWLLEDADSDASEAG